MNGIWTAVGESPELIVERVQKLLNEYTESFGISDWRSSTGAPWAGTPESLADTVRSHVTAGMFGEPEPESGYVFTVSGQTPNLALKLMMTAGAVVLGRRNPLHQLTLQLRELVSGGVSGHTGDILCTSIVRAWDPAMVVLGDRLVNRTARRGNWKIGVGYRLWLSAEVGTFQELADGLSSSAVSGGTLISAPDDWPADRVVAAMTATLTANGLDEIPH